MFTQVGEEAVRFMLAEANARENQSNHPILVAIRLIFAAVLDQKRHAKLNIAFDTYH